MPRSPFSRVGLTRPLLSKGVYQNLTVCMLVCWLGVSVLFAPEIRRGAENRSPGQMDSRPVVIVFSVLCLAYSAVVGGGAFVRGKRVPVLLGVVQVGLYAGTHYQVYTLLGDGHYACDRPPAFLDWVGFTAAHVVRAADILDMIEEYGIDLQHIHHASPVSGGLLVAMHLTVDVFLIGLAVQWGKAAWRRARPRLAWADPPAANGPPTPAGGLSRGLRVTQAAGVVASVLLCVSVAVAGGWEPRDWVLWPVDAALRVADVGDVMNVFHWRLHDVPPSPWLSALAVFVRVVVGLYLARWVTYLNLVVLKGAIRSIEELEDDLSSDDPRTRGAALAGR